jgi:VCBS repeat-containing protein
LPTLISRIKEPAPQRWGGQSAIDAIAEFTFAQQLMNLLNYSGAKYEALVLDSINSTRKEMAMATMTFRINDASTSGAYPAVWVTISENIDGTLRFDVTQEGGLVGDLRGLFFDLADESILQSLIVSAASSDIRIGDDSIKDLGDGANMNGLLGSDKGYDVGIEIGSSGIGKDDIQSYSFTLDSSVRDLTLSDFANIDFAARLTSVGAIGGVRTDSSKILELTSQAVDARNDLASVDENQLTSGNVLTNDGTAGGASTVTDWSGGAVGSTVTLESDGDIIGALQFNADGSYLLDASAADELSEGEHLLYSFTYGVKNQTEATSWSNDTASINVVISGKNDGPLAADDVAATAENVAVATGSVLANDRDVDRLDTISVTGWTGGELGMAVAVTNGAGATVTLNADGSYAVDASAANALSAGESITQEFAYTLSDNHGATDTAVLSVTVSGTNDGPEANDDAAGSIAENGILSGSVAANDSDIDRLDFHTWALVDGSFNGLGSLSMSADGTWIFDAQGAYDYLNDGEGVDLLFDYAMTDNHGASDLATVSFRVAGVGFAEPPPPPPPVPEDPPTDPAEVFLFNHGTNAFDHGWFPQLKDNAAEGFTSNDMLKIAGYGDAEVLTISEGDYGYGDAAIDDTMFVIGIDGNRNSTRTEDVGYLVDYTGLTEDQVTVVGNQDIEIIVA